MTTLAQDIQAIHDYIEANGWRQGEYFDADSMRTCIRGASHRCLSDCFSLRDPTGRAERFRNFLVKQIKQMGLDWEWRHEDEPFICGGYEDVVLIPVITLSPGKMNSVIGEKAMREPVALYNDTILKSKEEALEFLDKARIAAEEQGL